MDKIYYITLLLDFYGELLTCKQRSVMSSYYFDDYSLNEIAEEHSITRQAVQDMIKRTEKLLKQYEQKLMLVDKYLKRKEKVENIVKELDRLIGEGNEELLHVKSLVDRILD
ncbi:MAG: putative DNA-binding protein [Clostridia bacterium]|nr:putative DNA-binding protein [Clostridia bacterium]